ncbi:putative ABC transport system permease protein [Kitasatospora sp. MAP12-15]|uniref:FtsX-like permease family protein n=1 Tax=unclassified Kitasatospora TaxID=2633591 RepID=UPI0024741D30|nr:FtsX-like permease family protein [Kitasatospora sp. MAP12-44]MDH6111568.1 putative ABC transport system permease protein [Kitasatospora sp. MAP12-44]
MNLSSWRAALRVARRDALRAKGRSALIVAMIALPVVGVTAADVVTRSSHLSPQERSTLLMGASDAYVSTTHQPGWRLDQAPDPSPTSTWFLSQSGPKPSPTAQELARAAEPLDQLVKEAMPPGARLLPVEATAGYVPTSTAYGQGSVETWGMDLTDPLTRGIVTLRQGSWPSAPYEVAATTGFLSESGLHVGQSTTLAGTTQPLKITSAVEYPGELGVARLVGRPGELSGLLASTPDGRGDQLPVGSHDFLVAMPGHAAFSWQQVKEANAYGFTVASRAVLADPPPDSAVPFYSDDPHFRSQADTTALKTATIAATVAGMALLEIVLLAGPAFAVGARRSRRQLGLIAACGGNRAHIRAVVLGGGVVLGGTGAAAGAVLGALAVLAGRSALEARAGARFGHFALEPADLLAIVAIGVVTGLLAAIVPAVQASRQPVLAALTGRATTRPPTRWLTLAGLLMALAGAGLALVGKIGYSRSHAVMAGSMLAEVGLVACTPWLVSQFGRIGRILPLGPRLAVRDAARHRGRSAPAVAAVLAAVAGAAAVLTFQASGDSAARADYAPEAPKGAVIVQAYQVLTGAGADSPDATARNADAVRSAVEQAIPGLGQRGDLRDVTYGACGAPGGFCGTVHLMTPPANVCPPAAGLTSPQAVAVISLGQAQQLLAHDPRCAAGPPVPDDAQDLVIGDATVLHNLLGVDDPAAGQALAAGQVVVLDPRLVQDGKVTLQLTRYGATGPSGNQVSTISVPAVAAKATAAGARAVLSPAAAAAAGLLPDSYGFVWLPAHPPTSAEQQRAASALATAGKGKLAVERGYQGSGNAIALGLAVAASVVAIAAACIATGLAAADSQSDLATLAAVGAGPGIRRRLSGFQCGAVAALGSVIGVLAGLVPAAAIQRVQNLGNLSYVQATGGISLGSHPLVIPWTYLAVLVVGLPLLCWLLAAGFTRSRTVLARRTQ